MKDLSCLCVFVALAVFPAVSAEGVGGAPAVFPVASVEGVAGAPAVFPAAFAECAPAPAAYFAHSSFAAPRLNLFFPIRVL